MVNYNEQLVVVSLESAAKKGETKAWIASVNMM